MKKVLSILLLLLWKLSFSQDTCKPRYDLPVHYEQLSQGLHLAFVEQGNGKPVLFIHGLGGNISHWLKSVHELSKKYHCLAIDLPGYGYSDKTFSPAGKDQVQFFADILADFITHRKLGKLILAGHSMGGQIAMVMAIQHPELVSKLVLVSPAGLETFTESEAALMAGATPASLFEKQDEKMIRYNFKQNFYEQPAGAEMLIQDRIRLSACSDFKQYAAAVSNSIKAMLGHPVKNELSRIKQPVLIIFGENDALIPNRIMHKNLTREDLLKDTKISLPQAKIVLISKAGHMVQFEKPVETNNAIKHFLQ